MASAIKMYMYVIIWRRLSVNDLAHTIVPQVTSTFEAKDRPYQGDACILAHGTYFYSEWSNVICASRPPVL